MKLTFYGGAGNVTGANYLLESGGHKIVVDCGMEQGSRFAERSNFESFAYNPAEVSAIFVTHAHIDHIGRIPKFWRDGFRGQIYSSRPTKDFADLLLLDTEHIMEKEAEHHGKTPLFTAYEIHEAMKLWHGLEYHKPITIGPFTVELYDAGHILGSVVYKISAEGKTIAFSGDLGNFPAPIIMPTEPLPDVNYCVIESTYGDRVHENVTTREAELEKAITDIEARKGVLLIPAFAMERTQDLLYHLNDIIEKKHVPRIPVYVDSPLAIKLTVVYKKYEDYFNKEAHGLVESGDDILNFPGLHLTLSTEQSKEINDVPPPKVIIAGSGMSHGGRILHHELRYLPDPNNILLFVGYQGSGSLGRSILDGAEHVTIFGEDVPVRCERRSLSGYSAHADQPHLLSWLAPRKTTLKKVFVVQGEPPASAALADHIRKDLGVEAIVPTTNQTVEL
ncbi:MAG TPA: MBL fold metallo-hydrolase [Candidatus Paceibacterota bacterium]|nr:MBL fold metallo-hydrolase [Candidatus Paceibacterota bacterium]